MDEPLSPALRRALDRAHRRARTRGQSSVEPEDLWIGLLAEEENQATALLRRHGVDIEPVRLSHASDESESVASGGPLPLAPVAGRVLARARELAGDLPRGEAAGSEELLVALLDVCPEHSGPFTGGRIIASVLIEDFHERRRPASVPVDPGDRPAFDAGQAERMAAARVVDANVNRLREALRVVEDYARLACGDAGLARELKDLRHRLKELIALLPVEAMMAARDTPGDVGTRISASDEYARPSLPAVAVANLRRAQEAARVLEEFSKLESGQAARGFEKLRYQLYTIEKALIWGSAARRRIEAASLYWLADPDQMDQSFDWALERALAGGVQVVQLRDKSSRDRELLALARQVREWTRRRDVLFIMNDRPDIAALAGADGVHVGQEELSVADVRRIVGPDMLVGVSTHSIEQARRAIRDGADYIGVGPVFPSRTKSFESFAGLDFVQQVAAEISLPAFAIGGVDMANLPRVLKAGLHRIAIGAAISKSPDPLVAAQELAAGLAASE